MLGQQLVDEKVAIWRHRRLRGVLARVATPDEHLVDFLTLPGGLFERLVRLDLVVDEVTGSIVAVHGDQDPATRVGDPRTARVAAETAEYLRMNHAQPRAGQHGDRQVGDHRHVQSHPVASLEPGEVTEHGGELVDPSEQLTVADVLVGVRFQLRDPDNGGLVGIGLGVPVDAIVGSVQLAADEPVPEGGRGGVQRGVPALVPGQQVGILREALGELVLGELFEDRRIGAVGLSHESWRRLVVVLFPPVNRDLGFGYL